ncbi:MAG: GntR family transcriptional regulator [Gammaproteobacteria bacterium]
MQVADLALRPIDAPVALKDHVYEALKRAIADMDIYGVGEVPRLDERQISDNLGVSRTPIREAIARLEQEGLVRTLPRRGAYPVRKTKREILEMLTVWAALESMAARLITLHASDAEIATLRELFATFDESRQPQAHIDEYSQRNLEFHQAIIKMSHCDLLIEMTGNLMFHMRAIRAKTISEQDRASRSIIDHMHIIEALERRETERAERLTSQHTLDLAAHVEKFVHNLE